MKHFMDIVQEQELNYNNDVLFIENLLKKDKGTLYNLIAEGFNDWEHRKSFNTLNDFQKANGISHILTKAENKGEKISEEELIYYFEYILNTIPLIKNNLASASALIFNSDRETIRKNIRVRTENLGYDIFQDNGLFFIVKKNSYIDIAKSIVDEKYNLDNDLILYNHEATNGDLNKKADILCRFYKYIESIHGDVKQFGFEDLYEDISKLMNDLDIRHNPTDKNIKVMESLGETEIEKWYDEIFRLCVSLTILVDYKSKKKDIKVLKGQLS